ncbi:hypothetical protein HYV57_05015 [Candidatus Peregrinibacteria bacterium]|nr:hypothetical protein [Candidatus Peregrinibacteria bacterium]
MRNILYVSEQKLVEGIAQKYPHKADLLTQILSKLRVELPSPFLKKYDMPLAKEFLRFLIANTQKVGAEKYCTMATRDGISHTIIQKCIIKDDMADNLFKILGSYGITRLIEDVLKKMETGDFHEKTIENLKSLIEGRNKLRQAEEIFLEKAFRKYLREKKELYKE